MEHSREMALRREGAGLVNVKLFASCARWSTSAGCRSSGSAEDKAGVVTRGRLGSVGAAAHAAPNGAPGLRAVLTELCPQGWWHPWYQLWGLVWGKFALSCGTSAHLQLLPFASSPPDSSTGKTRI